MHQPWIDTGVGIIEEFKADIIGTLHKVKGDPLEISGKIKTLNNWKDNKKKKQWEYYNWEIK